MKFKSFLLTTIVLVGSFSTFAFANESTSEPEVNIESSVGTIDSDLEALIQLADTQMATDGKVSPEVSNMLNERGIYKYMVTANNVNVRSGPGVSYSSYGQMNWGSVCYTAYNSSGQSEANADGYYWRYVLCGSPLTGTYGWIADTYLTEVAD